MRWWLVLAAATSSCAWPPRTEKPEAAAAGGLGYAQLWAAAGQIRLALGRCLPNGPARRGLRVRIASDGVLAVVDASAAGHRACIAKEIASLRVDNPGRVEEVVAVEAVWVEQGAGIVLAELVVRSPTQGAISDLSTGAKEDPCAGATPFGEGERQPPPTVRVEARVRHRAGETLRLKRWCMVVDGTAMFREPDRAAALSALGHNENVTWQGPLSAETEHRLVVFAEWDWPARTDGRMLRTTARRFWRPGPGSVLSVLLEAQGPSSPVTIRLRALRTDGDQELLDPSSLRE